MTIHFIWFGSTPHADLIAKVARKMRYLKMMFASEKNIAFYLWTTNNLQGTLHRGLDSQESLVRGWNLNVKTKDINELFNLNSSPYLSLEETNSLRNLFIKESFGSLSKMALAADILKMLILLHFGGLFMDAGLEINHEAITGTDDFIKFKKPVKLERELYDLNKGAIYSESAEVSDLKTRGESLLKKLAAHHLGFSYTIAPNRAKNPFDLQIMYSKKTHEADHFFAETLKRILNRFTGLNILTYKSDYQAQRAKRFGGNIVFKFKFGNTLYIVPKPGDVEAYTGVDFIAAAIELDNKHSGIIYRFLINYKADDIKVFPTSFVDFPGIYRKLSNPNYANWRDCYYTPYSAQNDTYESQNPYTIPTEVYKLVTDFFKKNSKKIQETYKSPEEVYDLEPKFSPNSLQNIILTKFPPRN